MNIFLGFLTIVGKDFRIFWDFSAISGFGGSLGSLSFLADYFGIFKDFIESAGISSAICEDPFGIFKLFLKIHLRFVRIFTRDFRIVQDAWGFDGIFIHFSRGFWDFERLDEDSLRWWSL